jgi:uncharacterized protein
LSLSKEKKVPTRRCLGCMNSFDKKSLIRIVKSVDGSIVVDTTGKIAGRGAYICKQISCLKKAQKSKRIENNLQCQISDEIFEKIKLILEEEINKNE